MVKPSIKLSSDIVLLCKYREKNVVVLLKQRNMSLYMWWWSLTKPKSVFGYVTANTSSVFTFRTWRCSIKLPVLIASLGLFRLICLHCIFWSKSSLVTHKCLCSAIFVQGWGWRKAAWGIFEKTHSSSHVIVKLWSDLTLVHWRWDERWRESKRYEVK